VKGDHLYLIHIAECMQRIDAYSQAGRKVFMESSMAQDAVIRNFEIIGEAAKRISEGVKMSIPLCLGADLLDSEMCSFITTWVWIWRKFGILSSTTCTTSSAKSN